MSKESPNKEKKMSKNPKSLLPEIIDMPKRLFSSFMTPWANFLEENWPQAATSGVRIYEQDNQLHVEAPLPGLSFKDIDVHLNNGILFISGNSREEEKDKKKQFYRSSTRQYSYSIPLPKQIDEKQEHHATFADGILKITFPLSKKSEAKKITVKSGQSKK